MIVSLNWIKKFIDIDMSIDKLAEVIGTRLVEIEDIEYIGEKYKDVLIVKVIESIKMENSDHLSICKIDDGNKIKDIERDELGMIQVVCGAANIREGLSVAWLPPKSVVPSTYSSSDKFILDSREIRGFLSNGMIASAKELDLSDDHSGILEIDGNFVAGTSFADEFELDDYLLNIENKSLTNRPDCFGVIGIAREIASICGKKFITPDWLMDLGSIDEKQAFEASLKVVVEDSKLSSRYQAVMMDNVKASAKSPFLVQSYLSRVGIRPINAIVDATNYLMIMTGQPLHAFDYDKLKKMCGNGDIEIHVRSAQKGEKLELLDGKIIALDQSDIVIATIDQPIALAGAMGGLSTAIDESTSRIIIESATFNLYRLRSTQMRHGIFSEAITRFTKGQPASLTGPVIKSAVKMISDFTDAKQVGLIASDYNTEQQEISIEVKPSIINLILGSKFDYNDIYNILDNSGFIILEESEELMIVKVPYWRCDIHIIEDIAEEIGRISGFNNITPTLPSREIVAVKPSEFDIFRAKVRRILVSSGANEILQYSFVHGDILKKAGLDTSNSYRIINSISPDLKYCRQSLTPNMLACAYMNIKQGFDEFALFEINKTHKKTEGLNNENVPVETNSLALVYSNKNTYNDSSYYRAKKYVSYLCESFGVELDFRPISTNFPEVLPFEQKRSALIFDTITNFNIGVVGEYRTQVANSFKIPKYSAGFEINLDNMFKICKRSKVKYTPQSKYPASERDICFKVIDEVNYSEIVKAADKIKLPQGIIKIITPVDIFKPDNTNRKNITIRIKLTSARHTLTSEEVSGVINEIIDSVVSVTKATVV